MPYFLDVSMAFPWFFPLVFPWFSHGFPETSEIADGRVSIVPDVARDLHGASRSHEKTYRDISHMLHVWWIYLDLGDF